MMILYLLLQYSFANMMCFSFFKKLINNARLSIS